MCKFFLLFSLFTFISGENVKIYFKGAEGIFIPHCAKETGEWQCTNWFCTGGNMCETGVFESISVDIKKYWNYKTEKSRWNCSTRALQANCEGYDGVCGAFAEPLTVSTGASDSVLLSQQFSAECPRDKICFNPKLERCCPLKKNRTAV